MHDNNSTGYAFELNDSDIVLSIRNKLIWYVLF